MNAILRGFPLSSASLSIIVRSEFQSLLILSFYCLKELTSNTHTFVKGLVAEAEI